MSPKDFDPNCLFCKIIAGQIPCLRVFQDDAVLAFLDVGPLAEGHLLLVPKEHYLRLEEMPPEAVVAITRHLPFLGRAVMKATGSTAYNVLENNGPEAGQAVPHVHFHVIPRVQGDGVFDHWPSGKYPEGKMEAIASAIRKNLECLSGGA